MPTTESTKKAPSTQAAVKASKSEVFAWVTYHFANSGYLAVVAAAIFNAYFVGIVAPGGGYNKGTSTLLWTLAVGLSNFLVVVTGPMLGAICDYTAAKKKVLAISTTICILLTGLLYFVGPGSVFLGFILVAFSYFAFSTAENMLASFLPDICQPETIGRVSGAGCMVSHIGGVTVLGLSLAYVSLAEKHGLTQTQYVPITVLAVAFIFAIFSLPMFIYLKDHSQHKKRPEGMSFWQIGMSRLQSTYQQAQHYRDLFSLLTTIFLYTCGTSTVVVLAAVYAKQVMNFTASDTITMFIVFNITATVGAWLMGQVQDKLGSKPSLMITLSTWLMAILVLVCATTSSIFWLAAGCMGLANGASFTVGRACVGQFSPPGRAGEFFGLWGFAAKFAAIIGPISYGLISYVTNGNHRLAILSTAIFFAAALALAATINEKRGKQAALSPIK
jgi:UMF1 family MFS transporter